MTPGARLAATIEVLDTVLLGAPAEKTLTNWGRNNRFAGSKDRAAIRDLVFQAIRCRRSAGAWPVVHSARTWAIGSLYANNKDPEEVFTGLGHAPEELTADELIRPMISELDAWDLQDWTIQEMIKSYGDVQACQISQVLKHRAPVTLRVNTQKATVSQVKLALADNGIETSANQISDTALTVENKTRQLVLQDIFSKGWFELQDAASQAVAAAIPATGRVLDYCAGGGGKSLALAARTGLKIFAHDVNLARMSEIGPRSARGGHDIVVIPPLELDPKTQFDTVICDLPCTGSGAWRRSPEGKWTLTENIISKYVQLQREILTKSVAHLAPGGVLAFITCSIFNAENQMQQTYICENFPNLSILTVKQYLPSPVNDGLYLVIFKKFS
ncbi:MAG: RsmB/NOP family class I SAM-dependent RNA methyltransferase [Planktomarina sp.]|nr:RsmB/NOP family class I SAM-dependent RNA methyltransferase [Planktomarina sp.]